MSSLTLLDVSATQASNSAAVLHALSKATPSLAWLAVAPLAAALDDDDLVEPQLTSTSVASSVGDADVRLLLASCRRLVALDLRQVGLVCERRAE